MPLTDEEKKELKNLRKSFKQATGMDVDFATVAEMLHKNQKSATDYKLVYRTKYLDILEHTITPGVMKYVNEGKNTEGIGELFESSMKTVFDMTAPKNIDAGFEDEEDEGYGFMSNSLYNESIENFFNNNRFLISEAFYKYQERAYHPALGDDVYSKNYRDLSNKLNIYKKTDLSGGNKEEMTETFLKETSDNYMVVRDHYNSLGFFGKWFTKEGWNYRDLMNNTRETLEECMKNSGIHETPSELLHEYAKKNRVIGTDKEASYSKALSDFRQKVILDENEEDRHMEDFLLEDDINDSLDDISMERNN